MKMGVLSYDFDPCNEKQLSHIGRHFPGTGYAGSVFNDSLFPGPASVADFAKQYVFDAYHGERLVVELDDPCNGEILGYDGLVRIKDLPQGTVLFEEGGDEDCLLRVVRGIRRTPTTGIVIVVGPLKPFEDGIHGFYTIYPGKKAEPRPRSRRRLVEMGYRGRYLEILIEANRGYADFWKNHALIVD